jgi:hypothetical protein
MKAPEKLCFAFFVVGVLASLFAFVHPWYDRTNDGSTYILASRALAAGEGYTYLGAPFHVRPPGFSALIAPLVGGERTSFAPVNLLISLFGAAGVVLLYLHQRAHVGRVLGLLTSAAVWLNPGYQRLCNQVMSDVPGLTLLLGCLLLERWASRNPCWRREILLGLAIGLAAYVRSITILLVPAIILARILARVLGQATSMPGTSTLPEEERGDGDARREGTGIEAGVAQGGWWRFVLERLALVAVCVWLVLLPWTASKRIDPLPSPADQTLNYSLSTAMWNQDPGDPGSPRRTAGEILARVPPRLREVALVLGSRLQHRIPGSPLPDSVTALGRGVVALLLVGCLLAVLVRRGAPAEWFAAAALLVVAVYFIFTDRLVLPVYVFALAAMVEILRDSLRRWAGERTALIVPAAALLLLIAIDFKPRHDWPAIEARHRAFGELAASVDGALEPDARLGAGQGFHYGVYLERPVYTLMHAVRRAGRLEAAEQIIDKYELNTIVLSPLVPPDQPLVPYFTARYGPGTPAGPALTWRVRP